MTEPGPFDHILQTTTPDRRDRGPLIVIGVILGLALLLLILVLPPVSMLGGGGGDAFPKQASSGQGLSSSARSSMPDLPAGFEAVSPLYDIKAPSGGESTLTLRLKEKLTGAQNLGFYSYTKGEWKRIATAGLTADGAAASGDVPSVPANVAVLRRSQMAETVLGFVPAGAAVDDKVGGLLRIVSPLSYLLAAGGDVAGAQPTVPPSDAYRLIPTIIAAAPSVLEDMLRSPDAQQNHVQALTALAKTEGFAGVNVDYRQVNGQQRDDFVNLVSALAQALHQDGRQLVLTLPLPSKEPGGWETGGFDWQKLAPLPDLIVVRPDDDQSLYLKRTREGLDYAIDHADRAKLLLQITTLSREKGSEGVRNVPLVDALALAAMPELRKDGSIAPGESVSLAGANLVPEQGGTGLAWDDQALAVDFTYTGLGGRRTIWLANAFSIAFRLDIARSYRLGGVALEDVSAGSSAVIGDSVRPYAESGETPLVTPNPDMLAPEWSIDGGTLDATRGPVVVWRAPAEAGTYTGVLSVGDGVVRVGQKLGLEVQSGEPPG